jgi:hypothetical protein
MIFCTALRLSSTLCGKGTDSDMGMLQILLVAT